MRADEPGDDEPALIRAAARGDVQAFGQLYDRHVGLVVRRLSHLVGPCGPVDDLVQETFLRAMKALPGFRHQSPLRHWLLRIASSVAIDEQRRTSRSIWRLFAEPDEIDEAASSAHDAERCAELVAVHRALRRLSPRLRLVVVQFELEGQSLAEIAAELDVSIHTVGSRLRRGREQLRTLLEQSGWGDATGPLPLAQLPEHT